MLVTVNFRSVYHASLRPISEQGLEVTRDLKAADISLKAASQIALRDKCRHEITLGLALEGTSWTSPATRRLSCECVHL